MAKEQIRILGIDPGTHRIGFAILDKEGRLLPQVVKYGTIEIPQNTSFPESLFLLREELQKIVIEYKPTCASVESLYFNKNLKTAGSVYQARGVILLTLYANNVKIIEPSVTQIKKGVTGSGKADKKDIHNALKLILRLTELKGHDDSWDAIACAFVGLQMI